LRVEHGVGSKVRSSKDVRSHSTRRDAAHT
jgi:hypothetical protein